MSELAGLPLDWIQLQCKVKLELRDRLCVCVCSLAAIQIGETNNIVAGFCNRTQTVCVLCSSHCWWLLQAFWGELAIRR